MSDILERIRNPQLREGISMVRFVAKAWILFVMALWVAIIGCAVYAVSEISDRGLKAVITDIWEGPQA